ncbi:hypothetical protein KP509_1Z012300 [Ceratopteris richardii]|nr:hypothetical protein KP509_1Z012300 [Ceratopteris richardii]
MVHNSSQYVLQEATILFRIRFCNHHLASHKISTDVNVSYMIIGSKRRMIVSINLIHVLYACMYVFCCNGGYPPYKYHPHMPVWDILSVKHLYKLSKSTTPPRIENQFFI